MESWKSNKINSEKRKRLFYVGHLRKKCFVLIRSKNCTFIKAGSLKKFNHEEKP